MRVSRRGARDRRGHDRSRRRAPLQRIVERDDGRDFPFYDGDPLTLATWKWIAVIAACAVGFFVLITAPAANQSSELVDRMLFPAIPLALFIGLARG